MKFIVFVIPITLFHFQLRAQTSGKENSLRPDRTGYSFPSRAEVTKRERQALKSKTTVDLQKEYYERVKTVAKTRKKAAREMEKPQYSDFRYFGHKRIPKRRSPANMRFCRECGIRH